MSSRIDVDEIRSKTTKNLVHRFKSPNMGQVVSLQTSDADNALTQNEHQPLPPGLEISITPTSTSNKISTVQRRQFFIGDGH